MNAPDWITDPDEWLAQQREIASLVYVTSRNHDAMMLGIVAELELMYLCQEREWQSEYARPTP
jgi:hypothetical protein